MAVAPIDLSTLRKALAQLNEAITFWQARADGDPLKPHLRSSVIQSFEFSYELSVRAARRVLDTWRRWRGMRNGTSHAYDEERAQAVALEAAAFASDAAKLLEQLGGLTALPSNPVASPSAANTFKGT